MFGQTQRKCSGNVALAIFAILFGSAEMAHFRLLAFSHFTGHLSISRFLFLKHLT